ncbi:MAG: hypothetical protein ABSG51_07245, partial [Terracidiphilus sp.]
MKPLASWIAANYSDLIFVLICVVAFIFGFLRIRKRLKRSNLLAWWLQAGGTLAMLIVLIAQIKW